MIPEHTIAELEALWDKCREAKTVAELKIAARVYENAVNEYKGSKSFVDPSRAGYIEFAAKHANQEAIAREQARVIADEIACDGAAPTG